MQNVIPQTHCFFRCIILNTVCNKGGGGGDDDDDDDDDDNNNNNNNHSSQYVKVQT